MRESFGGAFMIKLILVYIVIYVTFMAVAVEYAKVFRVKNQVINMLEQSQFNIDDEDVNLINGIKDYLDGVPYKSSSGNGVDLLKNKCVNSLSSPNNKYLFIDNGICIEGFVSENRSNAHYKVTSYINIDFPFFNINMTFPISGETKTIYY